MGCFLVLEFLEVELASQLVSRSIRLAFLPPSRLAGQLPALLALPPLLAFLLPALAYLPLVFQQAFPSWGMLLEVLPLPAEQWLMNHL
jgi:hypothetical protein